jgi:N-acetylglucosamine-6-phosphate deacetylase
MTSRLPISSDGTQDIRGLVLTPNGFVDGTLSVAAGRIVGVRGDAVAVTAVRDRSKAQGLPVVLPGFIDIHVHGGKGADIMDGGDAALTVSKAHVAHGTTSMLVTTMTAPTSDLVTAFKGMAPFVGEAKQRDTNAARILGVHLEGPYINPGNLGAQPDFARTFDSTEFDKLHAMAPIRLVTIAPEIVGHLELVRSLAARGFKIQLGHSSGDYDDTVAALKNGAHGFTHLFNAMTGMHHRRPGMVGAALAHAQYAEIIPDLLHVHEGAIRVALRSIPKLFCVTDSTSASGMPDGEYRLGRNIVTKCLGGVRLADGTLAGSALTMDQALRNLVDKLGLDLIDASRRVTGNAAEFLGLKDRGALVAGAHADVVTLDADLMLQRVLVEGAEVERIEAAVV